MADEIECSPKCPDGTPHIWHIDDRGMGQCKKCPAKKEFALPWNVEDKISKKQRAEGLVEVKKYRYLNSLMPTV